MLVLTRKLMEKLFIGDDICVTVVRLEGGQVRLGIEAPRSVAVVRAELVPERERQASPPRGASAHEDEHAPRGTCVGPGSAPPGVRLPRDAARGSDSQRRVRFR